MMAMIMFRIPGSNGFRVCNVSAGVGGARTLKVRMIEYDVERC